MNSLLAKVRSKPILKKIFGFVFRRRQLLLIKDNNFLKKKLDYDLNDHKICYYILGLLGYDEEEKEKQKKFEDKWERFKGVIIEYESDSDDNEEEEEEKKEKNKGKEEEKDKEKEKEENEEEKKDLEIDFGPYDVIYD